MAQPHNREMLNGNSETLRPLLASIAALRTAYTSVTVDRIPECDRKLDRVVALLAVQRVRVTLDGMLSDQPGDTRRLDAMKIRDEQIRKETELCSLFGYDEREVKRYIRRTRAAATAASELPKITSCDDLMECLTVSHERLKTSLRGSGRWISGYRATRRARKDAQKRLFFIGAIIADALWIPLFQLSFSLGRFGLAEAVK
jgi:hypothetical protein